MFDTLIQQVNRKMAQMSWDLALCTDVYRLRQLLVKFKADVEDLTDDATQMVTELENQGRE